MSSTDNESLHCSLIDAMIALAKALFVMCTTVLVMGICPNLLRHWYLYQKDLHDRRSAETRRAMNKVFILPAVDHTGPRAVCATDILTSREYQDMLIEIPRYCPNYNYLNAREYNRDELEMMTDEEMEES